MKKRKSEEKLEELLADFAENLTDESSKPIESNSEEIRSLSAERDDFLPLLETARTISTVVKPKQPSEELMARVSQAVQERFQKQVSTEKIQRIIGMAVTDEDFRKGLFQDVVAACRSAGFSLTPKEIAALRSLKEDAVEEFAGSLDERITKFFPADLS